ncbi:unnamed protein product [Arctogadus glacialis]
MRGGGGTADRNNPLDRGGPGRRVWEREEEEEEVEEEEEEEEEEEVEEEVVLVVLLLLVLQRCYPGKRLLPP